MKNSLPAPVHNRFFVPLLSLAMLFVLGGACTAAQAATSTAAPAKKTVAVKKATAKKRPTRGVAKSQAKTAKVSTPKANTVAKETSPAVAATPVYLKPAQALGQVAGRLPVSRPMPPALSPAAAYTVETPASRPNPYLANSHAALAPVAQNSIATAQPAMAAAAYTVETPTSRPNPYLANSYAATAPVAQTPIATAQPAMASPPLPGGSSSGFSLPYIPFFDQAILPKIKTVYPTGEKPLVVVTLKCPTELVGIQTPSSFVLHKVMNGGMELVNYTNLLSFNMQQVCQ